MTDNAQHTPDMDAGLERLAENIYRVAYNPDYSKSWNSLSESSKYKYRKMAETARSETAVERDRLKAENDRLSGILSLNNRTGLPEAMSLYLSGIAHYARQTMIETNATTFEVKSDLNPKDTERHYEAKFTLCEIAKRQPKGGAA